MGINRTFKGIKMSESKIIYKEICMGTTCTNKEPSETAEIEIEMVDDTYYVYLCKSCLKEALAGLKW